MSCVVRTNRHGYLAYRLRWRGIDSHEGTGLRDTPEGRAKLQARAKVISDEMAAGTFDYLRWFPHGNQAQRFRPPPPAALTVCEYAETRWLPSKAPGFVRRSRLRDYRRHLRHILAHVGDVLLADLNPAHLEQVRRALREHGLAVKTIRNVVDGTFRALYRDARHAGLVAGDPFAALAWPRLTRPTPDPYTEAERDALLAYFRQRKRGYYAFVLAVS
jgi:hypothetical protein